MEQQQQQQLRNLRDFLLVYNRMTELCFQRCVPSLHHRALDAEEVGNRAAEFTWGPRVPFNLTTTRFLPPHCPGPPGTDREGGGTGRTGHLWPPLPPRLPSRRPVYTAAPAS
ncbi:mitochondrial import inner membrane translocase subunit Tim10 B isoform X1 [Erinaceus europaeus]|uniref:Mitochondrial import inner membrane translocase subunit n=1 Tax=Erinaceus europaeus TaxID=9365 RepID=A0A1S3WH82_ERIEU|nr:mitochondrial import inner membrane translocase subunit Tim10 B isoform X1 [Erinaceus europaeus]